MRSILSLAALALLLVGCSTADRIITDPAGAKRSSNIESNQAATPVSSSTDTDKHIWTQTPIPTVPPKHDDWRTD